MQPIILDESKDRCVRFKRNALVDYLLDEATAGRKCDMNDLARKDFPQADREQFAQLIGYSLAGYHELSYVSDESARAATKAAQEVMPGFYACRDSDCQMHCGVPKEV